MRIAFVLQPRDQFSLNGGGSVTIVTHQLAREIARKGHSVTIYARRLASQAEHEWTREGIHIHRLGGDSRGLQSMLELLCGLLPTKIPWTMQVGYYRKFMRNLATALARQTPDLIHVPTHLQYLKRLRKDFPRVRLVLHLHDEMPTHLPSRLLVEQLASTDLVLCVRNHIRDRLIKRLPQLASRIHTLHLGADTRRFTPGTGATENAPPVLLFVGRISPEKGGHILAAAFARIYQQFPSVRLRLVGSVGLMPFHWIRALSGDPAVASLRRFYGNNIVERVYNEVWQRGRGYLRDIKNALGPALEATEFHPPVAFTVMPQIYQEATMLIAPSVCTELATPLWEAMASGLPVIMAYDRGNEGIFQAGRTAVLVARNDSRALAKTIIKLLYNTEQRTLLGRNARKSVLANGSWAAQASKLLDLYESNSVHVAATTNFD